MLLFTVFLITIIIIINIYNYIIIKKEINNFYQELEEEKKEYIPYSKINKIKTKYKPLYNFNNKNILKIKTFNKDYDELENIVNKYNKEYISKEIIKNKEYFNNLFEYKIDEHQREAIIKDDDNNLIIAGAGSGKTTTIIGKTKYLIEKKNINPKEIITIAFTNNAVKNFKEKLNNDLVECTTFHKLGLNILNNNEIKKDIANENLLKKVMKEYFKNDIYKDKIKLNSLIQFYALYMHIPTDINDNNLGEIYELENDYDLETIKSKYINYQYIKNEQKLTTLKDEVVKSYEELIIANFLFINGINYEYEPSYKYKTATQIHRQYHPDFYLTDYDIYLEHFGINEKGKTPQYTKIEEQKYLETIEYKRQLHKKNNTILIETYSYYIKNGTIFNKLSEELKKYNIESKPIDNELLAKIILTNQNKELKAFYSLIEKFIRMFKGNNYTINKMDQFITEARKTNKKRNLLILNLLKDIYIKYQNKLEEEKQIDFDDMINLATKKVNNGNYNKKISYIIIDEFQDISYSRYCLVKAIQDKNNAKVIAVGDDWQSIYRFSGCDLDLFVNFYKYFPHPKKTYIVNTYRNSQELINISSKFIMKNEFGQIPKKLISNKSLDTPIEFYYYKSNIMVATTKAIENLKKIGCKKIIILGRNNSDLKKYINTNNLNFEQEYNLENLFNYPVSFTTVHKSKGLEYDGVIICNMNNFIAGFPNKMSDDPVLDYVTLSKEDYLFEEERRLLYVALTRTKTKCILLVPILNPSIFIEELYKLSNKKIKTTIIEDDERLHNPNCPICQKGTLIIRNNSKDNSKFISCTNYPKCTFTSNFINLIDKPIVCPKCSGYLVKRNGIYGQFYGCINYPICKQTAELEDNKKS